MQSMSGSSFNPMTVLSNKAREAVKAVFDAMSAWRNEIAAASDSNSQEVLDKMAKAARRPRARAARRPKAKQPRKGWGTRRLCHVRRPR